MEKAKIYYDGDCTLCSGLVKRIQRSSEADAFEPIAIQRETPAGVSYPEADHDMHVVDAEGRIYKGAEAVRYIISRYSAWNWTARLFALPGFSHIAVFLYRIVADNRKRWFTRI